MLTHQVQDKEQSRDACLSKGDRCFSMLVTLKSEIEECYLLPKLTQRTVEHGTFIKHQIVSTQLTWGLYVEKM